MTTKKMIPIITVLVLLLALLYEGFFNWPAIKRSFGEGVRDGQKK